MVDPNNPIIDPRSTVLGGQPAFRGNSAGGASNAAQSSGGNTAGGSGNTAGGNSTQSSGGNSSNSSSTTVKTTISATPISTTIPDEFKGSTNQDVIDWLEKKVKESKPLTDADLTKIRRRQKIEGIISGVSDAARSVANLIFTHHYAPNMYNAKESMSAKAKERFDKEKAEREAKDAEYFNYAMQLGKLKSADQDRALQIWQTEQTLARQDRAYDDARKDREDDVAFRNKDYDEKIRQWQASFDRQEEWHKEEGQRWERQFLEGVREFNVSAANEKARIGLEAQRLAHSLKEGHMTFNLGSGNGNVTLTLDKLNAQTVSRIYSTLPENVRTQVQGDPIVQNGFVVGYKPPTTEAMLIAIGANVETSPATQNAIKQVAGLETGKKPAGY